MEDLLGSALHMDGDRKDELVSSLQGLSVNDVVRKLRDMPLCLADKKEIRYGV